MVAASTPAITPKDTPVGTWKNAPPSIFRPTRTRIKEIPAYMNRKFPIRFVSRKNSARRPRIANTFEV